MNKKIGGLFLLTLVLVGLISAFVSSQGDLGGLKGDAENLSENVEGLRDFVEGEKYNYLGEQWKEILLKNKYIARANGNFEKINFLFVILFARDWSFSLEMLFVFMLWLFTYLSINSYSVWFNTLFMMREGWQRALASLAATLILAHIQVFNTISRAAVKVMFYRKDAWWNFVAFIVLIVALAAYLFINKYWARKIKKAKEKQEKADLKSDVKANTAFREEISDVTEE